jgi:hypothetical protein
MAPTVRARAQSECSARSTRLDVLCAQEMISTRMDAPHRPYERRRRGVDNAAFGLKGLSQTFANSRFYLPLVVLHEGRVCIWEVPDDPEVCGYGEIS